MKNNIWLSPSLAAGAIAARLVVVFNKRSQTSPRKNGKRKPIVGGAFAGSLMLGASALGIAAPPAQADARQDLKNVTDACQRRLA